MIWLNNMLERRKIKEEFINTFENIQNTDSNNNLININALWNIIIKIMANRLSYYLRVKLNKKINIIINNTQFPFITGDQPIINLDYNTNKIVYENWYYPISRNLGIIYTDKNINEYFLDSSNLTVDEVKILNNHIYNNALEQVYSDKVSVLESYI